jgi:hypothetical protein
MPEQTEKPKTFLCNHCDAFIEGGTPALQEHLITRHGYVRSGNFVSRPLVCHCGKSALYNVKGVGYCGAHRVNAQQAAFADVQRENTAEHNERYRNLVAADKCEVRLHSYNLRRKG